MVTVAAAAWVLVMFSANAQPPVEPWLAMLVAVFALASRVDGRRLWMATSIAGGLFLAGEIRGELAGQGTGNVLPAVVFYVLIFVLGRMVHAHRRRASGQQDRAERLEREHDALAARAVAAERSRIARELHDVIAHSLSVIVVQAAAERRVLGPGRDSTAETLEAIEQAGRQAMTELRRLLGLLRKSDGELSLAPQPGLGELGDLVAEVRGAGVEVDVRTDGDLAVLPRGLDLTAYRIVQECLTNVLKHAGAHRVEISLRCLGRCLDIDVTDDGTSDGAQAVARATELAPNVVLMDIRMPRLDGIEATRRLTRSTSVQVLVLTTYDLDEYVFEALRAGASGFLLKDSPPDTLISGIATVARGDALLAPSVTRRLITEFARRPPANAPRALPDLTPREREVLIQVARGLSNREIASQLFLGEATIKTYVGNILMKLGCRDRVQAVVAAYEAGLVQPGHHG